MSRPSRVSQRLRSSGWCKECGRTSNTLKFGRCFECRKAYVIRKRQPKKRRSRK